MIERRGHPGYCPNIHHSSFIPHHSLRKENTICTARRVGLAVGEDFEAAADLRHCADRQPHRYRCDRSGRRQAANSISRQRIPKNSRSIPCSISVGVKREQTAFRQRRTRQRLAYIFAASEVVCGAMPTSDGNGVETVDSRVDSFDA